jgi:hypothetical protein
VGVGPLVVCHYVRSRQQSWRGASFVQCAPPAGLLTPQFRFDSVDDPLFDRCVGCDLPSCPECRFSNGVMGFMEVVAFVSAQWPQIPSTPPRTPPTPHPYPTPFALHGFHFVSIQNIPALCRSQLSYPSSYVAWGSTFCLPYPTPHQPPSPSTPPTRHPPPTPLPTPHHHPPPHPQTKNNVIYIYIYIIYIYIYIYTSATLTILIGISGLGSFAWDRLLGNFRLGSFAWERSFGFLRLGTFAWDLSLEKFRLRSFALKLSLGSLRLGTFALVFRVGTFAWDISLGCLGAFA